MTDAAARPGVRARLLGRVGEMRGARFEIGAEATIGRNAGNSVVLASPLISGEHARIVYEPEPGCFYLEDLGSLNGTELDGAPVSGRERLGRLHVIGFGGAVELIYQGPEVLGPPPPAETAPAAGQGDRGAAPDERPPPAGEWVLVVTLAGQQQRFPLRQGVNRVGRSERAAVRIESPEVSRRHAVLTVEADRVLVRDEGSSNSTYVGGRRVSGEVAAEPGAELRFGKVEARLVRQAPAG